MPGIMSDTVVHLLFDQSLEQAVSTLVGNPAPANMHIQYVAIPLDPAPLYSAHSFDGGKPNTCVLITQVRGQVTPEPETEFDDCASFTCDEAGDDDCSDTSDLSANLDSVGQCTPTTGYCKLTRTRNGDGSLTYTGDCSSSCTSDTYDDSQSDTISVCCQGLACNLDATSLPTDCTGDTLPILAEGEFTAASRNFGDTASPTCNSGYKKTGTDTHCQGNGRWSSSTASCDRISCELAPLPDVTNGTYTTVSGTNSGDTASLQCDNDYKVSGTGSIECQEDETWSQSTSTCERKSCELAPLPDVTNGTYTTVSGTNTGDTASLQCDNDYKVSGTGSIECQEDETWSQSTSTCERKTCNPPPVLGNGAFNATSRFVGDKATAACNLGYELSGANTEIECQSNETWTSPSVSCDRIHCEDDPLPTVANGSYFASSKDMGDNAELTCNLGHFVNGSTTIECLSTRLWEAPNATCDEATDCEHDPLPVISNGVYSASSKAFGDTATATCDTGYDLGATVNTVTCLIVGRWETASAVCTKIVSSAVDTGGNTAAIAGGVSGSLAAVSGISLGVVGVKRLMARRTQVNPVD